MKKPGRLSQYLPDAAVAVAAVLAVAAAIIPAQPVSRMGILAAALVLIALGWLWNMREQRHLREDSEGRQARLLEEKLDLERLLDTAITSQRSAGMAPELSRILADLGKSLRADVTACYMLQPEIGVLRPEPGAFGVGPGSLHEIRLVGSMDDPLSTVLSTGEPLLRSGPAAASPRILPKGYGSGQTLLAPMLVEGEPVGILVVGLPGGVDLSDKDVALAMATASSCGISLENERVLRTSRQQVRHSTVIKEVALAVNSTLELSHVLHLFLGKARGIVDYDRAAVVLFDGDTYRVEALVNADGELERGSAQQPRGPLGGSVYESVKSGSLQVRQALGSDDPYATEAPAEHRLGVEYSEVLVPLRSKGEVVGCVVFRAPQPQGFPESMQAALYELANLGGMAIANSLTHSDTASQARHLDLLLGSLSEISRMLTATTEGPEALERRAVETVAGLFNSRVAVLSRVESGVHHVVATFGTRDTVARGREVVVVPGAGLLGLVALQQGTMRQRAVLETDLLPPLSEVGRGLDCGLAAPMFINGEFQGALAVFGQRDYDESETAVLTTVANQVAVALRNAELFHRSQRSLSELANLHEGLQAIASSLDMEQVLKAILTKAAAVSGAQIGSIMVLEEGRLHLRATVGTDGATAQNLSFGLGEGIAGKVVQTGRPILANDVANHPDFRRPESAKVLPKALLCVPMRLGDEVIGVINLSNYLRINVFDEDAVRVVASLASQTSVAVENARLYQHLRSERDRLISLEEVLRQDLARDLHDGPVQRLAGMAMNIEVIKSALTRDPDRALHELQELDKLVRLTIKEARTMLFELRPLVLETQGLPAALESYAEQFEATNPFEVELDLDEGMERMPPAVEQTIFSVVQEAMGNARKHARAQQLTVSLRRDGDRVVASVRDDGVGFDVEKTQESYAQRESQSLGLVNMVERAERIGGKLKLESAPGNGTTISISVPRRHLEVRAS
ncbi:MAG: GAF domain-containing protein [Candidatus Dormibacteraeota bacterium]|nr:GAF domain-containing protein [Candidatus Dormibacteraeota bacterium]